MERKAATTIRDAAREAGVSVSTVSRVLNDKDDVALETYERVQRDRSKRPTVAPPDAEVQQRPTDCPVRCRVVLAALAH